MFEIRETDILVIGGGGAGMRAAIAAAEMGKQVVLLSKGPLSRTGITPVAGEGVEGAVNEGDTPEFHYRDTLTAGRGLADENLVYALAQDSVARIRDLESYGAKFKKKPDGSYATSLRPGQSHSRNLFIIGGGYGFAASLLHKLAEFPKVTILEDVIATKILAEDGKVTVRFTSTCGQARYIGIAAKATILATGGYEELWPFTDTPPDTTGESLVQVYALGAQLVDLEQVLYYPGVVVHPPAARGWLVQYEYILNTDILDGRALNGKGEVFIEGFPARDEFIRAIGREVKNGTASPHGGFYADLRIRSCREQELTKKLEGWLHQFWNLKQVGIDLRDDKVEMAPAAHYCLAVSRSMIMAAPISKPSSRRAKYWKCAWRQSHLRQHVVGNSSVRQAMRRDCLPNMPATRRPTGVQVAKLCTAKPGWRRTRPSLTGTSARPAASGRLH